MIRSQLSIERIRKSDEDFVFVAMSFSKMFDHVYNEIIEPAIVDCGMTPVRSDQIVSTGNVIDEIVDVIRVSRAVIVELTDLNPNVLIELGVAHALEKTIVILSQDREKIPFDAQPRRVVGYNTSQTGSVTARDNLSKCLRATVAPREASLREMLWHGKIDRPFPVVYGRATSSYRLSVIPPVSEGYEGRLRRSSSSATGVWSVGLAYQRVAWSLGVELPHVWASDAELAPDSLLREGNAVLLGGPGSNPMVGRLMDLWEKSYANWPRILGSVDDDGSRRYSISRDGTLWPADQERLLEGGTDFGLVIRGPNPHCTGAAVWCACGIRSYGTEAAVRALTSPAALRDARAQVKLNAFDQLIWLLVDAKYDLTDHTLLGSSLRAAGVGTRRVGVS